jgi:hypothetical protein
MQSGRSERQHRPASQLPHECRSAGRTMDATDTAAPETRYCGRSQALLYNTIRPHASLRYKPPAPEVFVPAFAAWPAALGQPAGDDAEAVMLDFVQPHLPGGQRVSFGREAGGDEAGRKQTQHGSKHRCAAAKCESSEAEARGHSGRWGRAAPTPGQRGDDGYAGMPPRSNVDASPEARTLHRQWLAEG